MTKNKPVHYTLDIYGVELWLATNEKQWKVLQDEIDWLTLDPPNAAGQVRLGLWVPEKGIATPHLFFWIELQSHPSTARLVNTITHEAVHAAHGLMDQIGHQFEGMDEPAAYLAGWLAQWMFENIDEGAVK